MIEKSAVVYDSCSIDPTAYIGHFSIIGAPRTTRSFGIISDDTGPHWGTSRGTVVRKRATVGSHVIIGDGSTVGSRAFIGDGVHIGHDTVIGDDVEAYYRAQIFSRVEIGAGVWVGGFICNDAKVGERSVVFGSLVHCFVDAVRGVPEDPPILEDEVFIGMGAIVIGGVHVGSGAYIGAGSVLTTDAKSGRLYLGVPARECGNAPSPFRDAEARKILKEGIFRP